MQNLKYKIDYVNRELFGSINAKIYLTDYF
jgi:hypothetical protein